MVSNLGANISSLYQSSVTQSILTHIHIDTNSHAQPLNTAHHRILLASPIMASLTTTWLPKTPIHSPKIPAKSHQYPQSMLVKRCRLTSQRSIFLQSATRASNPSAAAESSSSSPGLYSAQKFELTVPNVDLVLEDVRPYLISDGGNVDVVSVEDGVVSLKLQGPFSFSNSVFWVLLICNT